MLNIARNTAIDYKRSKQGQNDLKNIDTDNVQALLEATHIHQPNYDYIGLKSIINKLNTEHQELIQLAYYEGYTQEEISNSLKMPLGSVKTKMRKAIILLRELVK
jgi:RNA polymerase sigma factor (sigma-70 family)